MEMAEQQSLHDATLCARAGSTSKETRVNPTGGFSGSKAIWQTSVYDFESLADIQIASHVYRRYGCPNSDELATAVAALERAEAGFATSTGMGAIVAAVMSNCGTGDVAIVCSDVYGATYEFFNVDLRRYGIDVMLLDVFDPDTLETAIRESLHVSSPMASRNVVIFLESITNPLVKVADIRVVAQICNKYGAILIVDNTMATPLRMKPLLEGASIVVHSATKFLGGNSDLMAGVVVGSSDYVKKATSMATRWGLTAAPFDAWLAIRGLHTLQVRMERAWTSAAILADRCAASNLVLQAMSAPKCAIICIEVCGGFEGANRAIKAFTLIKLSPSFGGTATAVSHSATSSHKWLGADLRKKLGITDGILRITVGLEDVEEIWVDLRAGLLAAFQSEQGGLELQDEKRKSKANGMT